MTELDFYAICAKGLGKEDGFYKVKAENFGDFVFAKWGDKAYDIKCKLIDGADDLMDYDEIDFCSRKFHASGGWHDEIEHKPVAFVVEVNSHLPFRPKISFDKEVKIFDSAENVGDEAVNTQLSSESVASVGADMQKMSAEEFKAQMAALQKALDDKCEPTIFSESFGEFKDTQNAQNNAKIQNEALKERLIANAREDCKRLRAIFIKIEVNTTLYFEDEKGEIKHLWFKNNEVEQYGAIKALMIMGKAFVLVDFAATRDPLIRFCQGFQSEFLNEPKEDEE